MPEKKHVIKLTDSQLQALGQLLSRIVENYPPDMFTPDQLTVLAAVDLIGAAAFNLNKTKVQ